MHSEIPEHVRTHFLSEYIMLLFKYPYSSSAIKTKSHQKIIVLIKCYMFMLLTI